MMNIKFSHDFHTWAEQNGLRNPFLVSLALFAESCHKNADGSTSFNYKGNLKDFREPTRAEKTAWIIARDKYIAKRCFNEISYEAFLEMTKPTNNEYDISDLRNQEEFFPCKSLNRQCSLECVKYGNCR